MLLLSSYKQLRMHRLVGESEVEEQSVLPPSSLIARDLNFLLVDIKVTYAVDDLLPDERSKRRKETLGEQAFGDDGLLSEEDSDDDFLPRENFRDDLGERTPSTSAPFLAKLSARTPLPSTGTRAAPLGPEQQAQLLKNLDHKRSDRDVKRQGHIESLRKGAVQFNDAELNDLLLKALNHSENAALQSEFLLSFRRARRF